MAVRTDSADCSAGFVWGCRARNVGFSVVARSNGKLSAVLSKVVGDEGRWSPAVGQDGDKRPGAAVAELTDLVDLSAWPPGPASSCAASLSNPETNRALFPSLAYRYWGHYADAEADLVALDVHMRAHAHVEDNVRRLRDSGFERFPFVDLDANRAWLSEVCFADDWCVGFSSCAARGSWLPPSPRRCVGRCGTARPESCARRGRWIVRMLDGWPTCR